MEYAIEMINITKSFSGIKANDHITLQLKKGEIHALLGENGAGKSTLMSILFGLYPPDSGDIKVNGKKVIIQGPNDANKLRIGMVHQHFKLIHNFTILENIILGQEDTKNTRLILQQSRKKVMQLSKQYHLNIDPDKTIEQITVGMQQRVEILKMLYRDNDILIFDEPTAMLTPKEIKELLRIMECLIEEGKSIIFITHKLKEIKQIADRCTIIRKGKYIDTVDVKQTSIDELSKMMVGRQVDTKLQRAIHKPKKDVLEVMDLSLKNSFQKSVLHLISFKVKAGEIVGIAGIEGNGQSELIQCITGLMKMSSGHIYLNKKDISSFSIRERTLTGMSYIPEDRHKHGLVLDYSLANNIILRSYFHKLYQRRGFIHFYERDQKAIKLIHDFDIRCHQKEKTIVRSMSGGNQQKAIIAREIDLNNDLIIAMQPTRGLDVGAIEFVHKELLKQRDNGKAVLLVSLELEEILSLSDRILVMYEGRIVVDVLRKDIDENKLGLYMAGGNDEYENKII